MKLRKTAENLGQDTVDEGYEASHLLKCGPLPPNAVCRIAQRVRKREGRKSGKGVGGAMSKLSSHRSPIMQTVLRRAENSQIELQFYTS